MYTHYYFLGIGGIGMSALARYFKGKGFQVAGYDRTKTRLTSELEKEGIKIHYEENISSIENDYKQKEKCLIVYTPAIPNDSIELNYFKNNDFRILKRAQILGEVTRQSKGICIAGTHGKTTTSTMTAHLLYSSAVHCSAFLGGVSNNYDKNILFSDKSDYVVIEADEYDRSFHQLSPYMALITASDADHLDIYKDKDSYRESFEHFASLVKSGGYLVVRKGLDLTFKLDKSVKLYSYSADEGDFHAKNIKIQNGEITFDFVTPKETVENIKLGVPVKINIENSVGAMALAYLAGVKPDELRNAMASYAGIRRRFEFQVKTDKIVYIDDYAHHPTELTASISSIKALYPDRKICGIFQPHLYSRTRDFCDEFAKSLSLLDELILLDIYPAREKPIEGVTSNIIFDKVSIKNKTKCKKEDLLKLLENKEIDVLITLGAGNIDEYVPKIKNLLLERINK